MHRDYSSKYYGRVWEGQTVSLSSIQLQTQTGRPSLEYSQTMLQTLRSLILKSHEERVPGPSLALIGSDCPPLEPQGRVSLGLSGGELSRQLWVQRDVEWRLGAQAQHGVCVGVCVCVCVCVSEV